ncbi:ribosomal protein L14E/L6E/L27E [Catenulispora sp. GAS73]|uniref:hypothetical protein n=1 Tax=Catenulispora sp. GAS73 TaxID=3156269 RepID=UPI003519349E
MTVGVGARIGKQVATPSQPVRRPDRVMKVSQSVITSAVPSPRDASEASVAKALGLEPVRVFDARE